MKDEEDYKQAINDFTEFISEQSMWNRFKGWLEGRGATMDDMCLDEETEEAI